MGWQRYSAGTRQAIGIIAGRSFVSFVFYQHCLSFPQTKKGGQIKDGFPQIRPLFAFTFSLIITGFYKIKAQRGFKYTQSAETT